MNMCCGENIITGRLKNPADAQLVALTPGRVVLFSPESPRNVCFSPSFTIVPGRMVLIDAYNMPFDAPIYVNRLIKSAPSMGQLNNCDPCALNRPYVPTEQVVFRARMKLGIHEWMLVNPADDPINAKLQILVNIPGTYELELSEPDMIGDMQVELLEWSMDKTPGIPTDYFPGVW